MLRVEVIPDVDLSRSIGSALLEMVSPRNPLIIMTGPASSPGAIRDVTLYRQRIPVESPDDDFLMLKTLRGEGIGKEAEQKEVDPED